MTLLLDVLNAAAKLVEPIEVPEQRRNVGLWAYRRAVQKAEEAGDGLVNFGLEHRTYVLTPPPNGSRLSAAARAPP